MTNLPIKFVTDKAWPAERPLAPPGPFTGYMKWGHFDCSLKKLKKLPSQFFGVSIQENIRAFEKIIKSSFLSINFKVTRP